MELTLEEKPGSAGEATDPASRLCARRPGEREADDWHAAGADTAEIVEKR